MCGLSFIHHPDQNLNHWGSLHVIYYADIHLPTLHSSPCRAGSTSQAMCDAIGAEFCAAFLDALENFWQLPPALMHTARHTPRVHWAEDSHPSCQDKETDAAARSALEALTLALALDPLSAPAIARRASLSL